jgi:hypothetical protein
MATWEGDYQRPGTRDADVYVIKTTEKAVFVYAMKKKFEQSPLGP